MHVNSQNLTWYIDPITITSAIRTWMVEQVKTPVNVSRPPYGPTYGFKPNCGCGVWRCNCTTFPYPSRGDLVCEPGSTHLVPYCNQFPYHSKWFDGWTQPTGDSYYFQGLRPEMVAALREFLPEHVFKQNQTPDLVFDFFFTSVILDGAGMYLVHEDELMTLKIKFNVLMPQRMVGDPPVKEPAKWENFTDFQTDEATEAAKLQEMLTIPAGYQLTARMERFGVFEVFTLNRINRLVYAPPIPSA